MDVLTISLTITEIVLGAIAILGTGARVGFLYGRVICKAENSSSSSIKKYQQNDDRLSYILKQCNTFKKNNHSLLNQITDIKLFYKKHKIVTNSCSALQGEKCSYTGEKCYLL